MDAGHVRCRVSAGDVDALKQPAKAEQNQKHNTHLSKCLGDTTTSTVGGSLSKSLAHSLLRCHEEQQQQ